jgi:hypothetical protein
MESELFELNEQASLDFEMDNQTWWMLREDVSDVVKRLTFKFQERLKMKMELEQSKKDEVDRYTPQGGSGELTAVMRVAPTAQVRKTVQAGAGATLSTGVTLLAATPAPPSAPSPKITPKITAPSPKITDPVSAPAPNRPSPREVESTRSLLDVAYENLRRDNPGEPVAARKLVKKVRDEHGIDLGMVTIKDWIASTNGRLSLNRQENNEMAIEERR